MKKMLLILLTLVGCAKSPEPSNLILDSNINNKSHYQIATKPIDEKMETIAGVDNDTIITIVTVPASSVPTKVTITEKTKTLRQKFFPKKSEASKPVGVISDNSNVTAEFIEERPWWEYVAWFIGIVSPILILINLFADKFGWLLAPLKLIFGLFKRKE